MCGFWLGFGIGLLPMFAILIWLLIDAWRRPLTWEDWD